MIEEHDTLFNLISYTKPQNNLILGSQFMTNKLFKLAYDYNYKFPYLYNKRLIVDLNDKRKGITYEPPFHVFVTTNKGHIVSTADVSMVTLDFTRLSNELMFMPNKITLNMDGVRIIERAYGVYMDSYLDTYTGEYHESPYVNLYITFLMEEQYSNKR